MATQPIIPRDLYRTAVVFDSRPTMQFAERRAAKKEALEEATTQYFNNLVKEVNPSGIRDIHLGGQPGKPRGVRDDIEDWKNKGYANIEAIKKGGTARIEFEKEQQAILRKIQQAKSRDAFLLELGKAKFKGEYNAEEDDLKVLEQSGKSVYDATSYKKDGVSEYGYADLSHSLPDLDAEAENKILSGLVTDMKAGKTYDYKKQYKNASTGQVIVPYSEGFSPEQIKAGAEAAKNIAVGDSELARRTRKTYNKILNSPQYDSQLAELDKAFQSVYGKDEFVNSPEEVAQARMILKMSKSRVEGEEQEKRERPISIRNYSGGGSGSTNTTPINDIYGSIDEKLKEREAKGIAWLPVSLIDPDEKDVIVAAAQKKNKYYTEDNLQIIRGNDGSIRVFDKDGEFINFVPRKGTNLAAKQPNVAAKKDVIKAGDVKPTSSGGQKKYQGLDKNGNPIFK